MMQVFQDIFEVVTIAQTFQLHGSDIPYRCKTEVLIHPYKCGPLRILWRKWQNLNRK